MSWLIDTINRFRSRRADRRWAGDRRTLRQLRRPTPGLHHLRVRFAGHNIPVTVRGGTMDLHLARQILRTDSEYRLPVHLAPRVIFDVGANIGMTALYFALTYPAARIYCFEPLPENVELLIRNTLPFADRITVIAKGIGERDGSLPYYRSNDPRNFGGGTFHRIGCDAAHPMLLPVTTVAQVCKELGIENIDVLKVDCEGAEMSVLRGTPRHILATTQAVIGELHGVEDLEVIRTMSETHRVGVNKRFDRKCYPFVALKPGLSAA
jgi:FkbM family methyltransferase